MHLRGKDFKFTVTKPGEPPQVVLSVPAYDFSWQTYYVLSEPIELPKGTRIDCLAHFDNSENNPYNPDPSKLVRFGEQTFDEMLIGYCDMDVAVGDPVPEAPQFESNIENAMLGLRRRVAELCSRGQAKGQAPAHSPRSRLSGKHSTEPHSPRGQTDSRGARPRLGSRGPPLFHQLNIAEQQRPPAILAAGHGSG